MLTVFFAAVYYLVFLFLIDLIFSNTLSVLTDILAVVCWVVAFLVSVGLAEYTVKRIKEKYKEFDSLSKFNISFLKENDNKGCSCGEVLIGLKEPRECKLFGTVCTPLTPIGACMVSEEGACSAHYKYC